MHYICYKKALLERPKDSISSPRSVRLYSQTRLIAVSTNDTCCTGDGTEFECVLNQLMMQKRRPPPERWLIQIFSFPTLQPPREDRGYECEYGSFKHEYRAAVSLSSDTGAMPWGTHPGENRLVGEPRAKRQKRNDTFVS